MRADPLSEPPELVVRLRFEERPVALLHADRFEDETRLLAYLEARCDLAREIEDALDCLLDVLRDRSR